ncbi:hypothetical protein FRB90_000349 [Tulasnella sp. 427]|nr:hypothetical protein FRB90_000349 [Tulasnella sp. 427]
MSNLDILAEVASSGTSLTSSPIKKVGDALPDGKQSSAPTRALDEDGSTNNASPSATSDSSSETSFYEERQAPANVCEAVDMEVEVLATILPTADPTSLAPSALTDSIKPSAPVYPVYNPQNTSPVFLQGHFGVLPNLPPSSVSTTSCLPSLDLPEDKPTSNTTDRAASPTLHQFPPVHDKVLLPTNSTNVPLNDDSCQIHRDADTTALGEAGPQEPSNYGPWPTIQTAERASTRIACKAASRSPTALETPQTRRSPAHSKLDESMGARMPVSPKSDRQEDQSLREMSPPNGAQNRQKLPKSPNTPGPSHQYSSLASPKGAIPYVEIPPYKVTAPTPVKHNASPAPESFLTAASSENTVAVQDVVMDDVEPSSRSRRKRRQNALLREYAEYADNLSSDAAGSRSPSPVPSAKKKRKRSVNRSLKNSDVPTRPIKIRVKGGHSSTVAPDSSIQDENALIDNGSSQPGPASQTSAPGPHPEPSDTSAIPTGLSGPVVQKVRCIRLAPGVPRCHACISKKTGELCRYLNIRQFPGGTLQAPVGIPVWIDDPREAQDLTYPSTWNVNPTPQQTNRVLQIVAEALLPHLAKELGHTRLPNIIRRSPELECRASCDYCATSIFGAGWICKTCGREFCSDCRSKILYISEHCSSHEQTQLRMKARNTKNDKKVDQRLMYCQGGVAEHYGADLRPITRFRTDELETAIADMGTIIVDGRMNAFSRAEPQAGLLSQHQPIMRRDLSDPEDPSNIGTLPYYVFSADNLTEDIFKPLWARGETVVVTGLLAMFQHQWTPNEFIRRYGTLKCKVVDCKDDDEKLTEMAVERFFSNFGKYEGRKTCWKLKDWPPTSLFSKEFPELYKDFLEALPVPNYTRRDGILNLAAHYPQNSGIVVPDIGPKMYNAFESSEASGGKGSTRLHMDMADAVNAMLYAAPRQDGSPGCAVWDIYRAEDSWKIRRFLNSKFDKIKTDPIHSQQYYLDSEMRKELFEKEGVKSWRIYQKPGEAVFIPAGCAHQVCNLADCIKVAVDFVSPENIGRCEILTAEFRQQNLATVWKDDVLQLRNTLLHAWNSMKRFHPSLSKTNLPTVIPAAPSPTPESN